MGGLPLLEDETGTDMLAFGAGCEVVADLSR